eukprot:SAG31_NODE_21166_length_556_cov_1.006565_1_plen_127_part_10
MGKTFQDDHHCPLNPQRYIVLRVEPMIRFYQARLPRYYILSSVCQVLLLLGALSGTFMTFLGVDNWAALVTAITAAITAWSGFHGTERKLSRYTNTVDQVRSVLLRWRHLSYIEKASPANVQFLVLS